MTRQAANSSFVFAAKELDFFLTPPAKQLRDETRLFQGRLCCLLCKDSGKAISFDQSRFALVLPLSRFSLYDDVQPVVSLGYYTRVASFRKCIETFICNGGKQIISLGAGFDTNFFHFQPILPQDFRYLELDFSQVVAAKSNTLQKQPKFASFLKNATISESGHITSPNYFLRSADLRRLTEAQQVILDILDPTKPTLILSECVLIYMTVEDSGALLSWVASTFTSAGILLYEQILPHDAFGQTMQKNLFARGCPLLSLLRFPNISDQIERFRSLGWSRIEAIDMLQVWDELLDRPDTRRAEMIEMFDELEEWRLIQSHYCLLLAVVEAPAQAATTPESTWSKLSFAALKESRVSTALPRGVPAPSGNPKFFD